MREKWTIALVVATLLMFARSSFATGHGDVYGVLAPSSQTPVAFLDYITGAIRQDGVDASSPISDCYHTIFLFMPTSFLTADEKTNIAEFAKLHNKHVVLVGENGLDGKQQNKCLNGLLGLLETQTRFSTDEMNYDAGGALDTGSGLRDLGTNAFAFRQADDPSDPAEPGSPGSKDPAHPCRPPNQPTADPDPPSPPSSGECQECPALPVGVWALAHVVEGADPALPSKVWVARERTKDGRDLVLIHDLSMFNTTYTTGCSNLAFVQNLCVDPYRVELDIDSDNNNDFAQPERTVDEDLIENAEGQTGKLLIVEEGDMDSDSVPDYADFDGVTDHHFVPIVLQVASGFHPTSNNLKFTFTYSSSDPALVTPQHELPEHGGHLRIWKKDCNVARSVQSPKASGDFIPPYDETSQTTKDDTSFTAVELGFVGSETVLYVEGVAANRTTPDTIRVKAQECCSSGEDTVMVTVKPLRVDLRVDSDNDGTPFSENDDTIEDDSTKPGQLIAVNNDDVDEDGLSDYLDGYDNDGSRPSEDEQSEEERKDNSTYGESFTPVRLTISDVADLENLTLRFEYSAVPPGQQSGGHARLWADADSSGVAIRDKRNVTDSGDFVPSGVDIEPFMLGLSTSNRTVTLYLEGIGSSDSIGSEQLKVTAKDTEVEISDKVRYTVSGLRVRALRNGSPCSSLMTGAVDAGAVNDNLHKCDIEAELLPSGLADNPDLAGKLLGTTRFTFVEGGTGYPVEGMPSAAKLRDEGDVTLASGKAATTLTSSNLVEDYSLSAKLTLTGSVSGITVGSTGVHQVGGDTTTVFFSVDPLALLIGNPAPTSYAVFTLRQEGTTIAVPDHNIRFRMAVVDELGQAVLESDERWPDFGTMLDATLVTDALGTATGVFIPGTLAGSVRIYAEDMNVYIRDAQ